MPSVVITQSYDIHNKMPIIIATTTEALARRPRRAARLARAGCAVLPLGSGCVDLAGLLAELGRRGMTNIMVEGGGRVLGAFFDEGLADEAWVYVAPKLIGGGKTLGPLGGAGPADTDRPPWHLASVKGFGDDRRYILRRG
ncbi:MAG: dihydrofolate reductase family protein [Desulfobacterales bacterium]|nr:MAG: dihydrofolate reductase family protein [Desulfobacterales bacterium]